MYLRSRDTSGEKIYDKEEPDPGKMPPAANLADQSEGGNGDKGKIMFSAGNQVHTRQRQDRPGGLLYKNTCGCGRFAGADRERTKTVQAAPDAIAGSDPGSAKRPAEVRPAAILHRKAAGRHRRREALDMVHAGGRGAGDRYHNGGSEKDQRAGDPAHRLSGAPADRQKRVKRNV